jgi:hypothetical protein
MPCTSAHRDRESWVGVEEGVVDGRHGRGTHLGFNSPQVRNEEEKKLNEKY